MNLQNAARDVLSPPPYQEETKSATTTAAGPFTLQDRSRRPGAQARPDSGRRNIR